MLQIAGRGAVADSIDQALQSWPGDVNHLKAKGCGNAEGLNVLRF